MSDSVSQAESTELAPRAAEEVIRRAIEIDAQDSRLVSLDELKATLAALDIPGETVERAAAEVRKEFAAAADVRTPLQLLGHLCMLVFLSIPGVWLVSASETAANPFGTWLMAGFGILWLLAMFSQFVDSIYAWWRMRRSLS